MYGYLCKYIDNNINNHPIVGFPVSWALAISGNKEFQYTIKNRFKIYNYKSKSNTYRNIGPAAGIEPAHLSAAPPRSSKIQIVTSENKNVWRKIQWVMSFPASISLSLQKLNKPHEIREWKYMYLLEWIDFDFLERNINMIDEALSQCVSKCKFTEIFTYVCFVIFCQTKCTVVHL